MIDTIIKELIEKARAKDFVEPKPKVELEEPDKERQLLYILSQQDRYIKAVNNDMKSMCETQNELEIKALYERAVYLLSNLREVCDMRAKQ